MTTELALLVGGAVVFLAGTALLKSGGRADPVKRGTAVVVGLVVAGLAAGIALKIHGVRKPPGPKPVPLTPKSR